VQSATWLVAYWTASEVACTAMQPPCQCRKKSEGTRGSMALAAQTDIWQPIQTYSPYRHMAAHTDIQPIQTLNVQGSPWHVSVFVDVAPTLWHLILKDLCPPKRPKRRALAHRRGRHGHFTCTQMPTNGTTVICLTMCRKWRRSTTHNNRGCLGAAAATANLKQNPRSPIQNGQNTGWRRCQCDLRRRG
jgi:hypothetical protein